MSQRYPEWNSYLIFRKISIKPMDLATFVEKPIGVIDILKQEAHSTAISYLLTLCKTSVLQNDKLPVTSDWEKVLELAVHHRITRTVESELTRQNVSVPASVQNKLKSLNKNRGLKMLSFTAELSSIGKEFGKREIAFIPLKGPVAAFQIYGDFAAKNSRDIDLLLEEEQLEEAIDLLEEMGYKLATPYVDFTPKQKRYFREVSNQLVFFHLRKRIQLELHWRLFANRYFLPLTFKELSTTSKKIKVGQEELLGLSSEHLLLYLCAHGAKHKWALLYWLHEIASLIKKEEFDWTIVLKKSVYLGIDRPLVQGLMLSNELLGVEVDSAIKDYYQSQHVIQKLFHSAKEVITGHQAHNTNKSIVNYWKLLEYKLKLGQGTKYKLDYLHRVSVRDFELIKLPDSLFFCYFWLRPIFWLWRYVISPKRN